MTIYKISQKGNCIELSGASRPVFYEITGTDLPTLTDYSFAVWHLLPSAMKNGEAIHIDGPVDPAVIANAEEFSRVWELWEPAKFREVTITSSEKTVPSEKGRQQQLACFSGGIDSTHMLLSLSRQEIAGTALTVHGMEIDYQNIDQFDDLLRWTNPLLDHLNYDRITVRTNATEIGGGYHSWGLTLAGCAFLFSYAFERCIFAADLTAAEDFLAFPWGLNTVTNRLLAGTNYRLESLCEDVSRVGKIRAVVSNPTALHTLSFCKKKVLRPRNCGVCNKCVRTKIMMIAALGRVVEESFIDPALNRKLVYSIDLSHPIERAFLISTYQFARNNGTLSAVPGLEERFESLRTTPIRRFLSGLARHR